MKYKWLIKESQEISKEFLKAAFNSEIVAKLLLNRGIDTALQAKAFLEPKFYLESKPEEIPDLLKAKDRILEALSKNEKITIFGDYDVDGVTSTSCLLLTLKQFTQNVDFYIPSRLTEGYGLNNEAVKIIAKKHKAKLLITCDCGITNHKEIELANELGMDVIVTDHHSLPEILPPAVAVLNPKQLPPDHKLHFLPGVGVVYKLAEAILGEIGQKRGRGEMGKRGRGEEGEGGIEKEDLLDLVTLGMIADLAPLVDENRYLVQIGLPRLAKTEKIGLKELLRICGCLENETVKRRNGETAKGNSPTTEHIGFGIAPRINAVGRLSDANLAVKLLTTNDLLEAIQIATELDVQNRQRQTICEETLNEAVALVGEYVDLKNDKCIVLAKENWHHGVVGIIASRIVEKYHLPTILIAIDKEQNIARGSGRSIEALNIVDALVNSSQYLEKYGGHKAACGLSIKPENIDKFIFDFKKYVNNLLDGNPLLPTLKIDLELPLSDLNRELLREINLLGPFGFGNPMPTFVSENVEIVNIRQIGKNGQHLKLTLNVIARSVSDEAISKRNEIASPSARNDTRTFEALIWNQTSEKNFQIGNMIKAAYTAKLNHYNGEVSIQLEMKDWHVQEGVGEEGKGGKGEIEQVIDLYDFRGNTQECLNLFSSTCSAMYFAETLQKDFLPLKTFSRTKIAKTENLVLLECPPDENSFIEIIQKSSPLKLYLAFSMDLDISNQSLALNILKRLIGMLQFSVTNKASKVKEDELLAALGLNKSALSYGLEVLVKTGFLIYKRNENELNITIQNPARQNFSELIEYKLFTSELNKILEFRKGFCESVSWILKFFDKNKIQASLVQKERETLTL